MLGKVLLVYTTDAWHSMASRDIIGVATSNHDAILICDKKAEKDEASLNEEDVFMLANYKQTQGLKNVDYEFVIEEIETDTLI